MTTGQKKQQLLIIFAKFVVFIHMCDRILTDSPWRCSPGGQAMFKLASTVPQEALLVGLRTGSHMSKVGLEMETGGEHAGALKMEPDALPAAGRDLVPSPRVSMPREVVHIHLTAKTSGKNLDAHPTAHRRLVVFPGAGSTHLDASSFDMSSIVQT